MVFSCDNILRLSERARRARLTGAAIAFEQERIGLSNVPVLRQARCRGCFKEDSALPLGQFSNEAPGISGQRKARAPLRGIKSHFIKTKEPALGYRERRGPVLGTQSAETIGIAFRAFVTFMLPCTSNCGHILRA
jgi:hypothetical protein